MSERPILFSGSMVRAILEGRKTQTRRMMRQQPPADGFQLARVMSTTGDRKNIDKLHWVKIDGVSIVESSEVFFDCPYGLCGDLLWVRETWHPSARPGTEYEIEYRADSSTRVVEAGYEGPTPKIDAAISEGKWKPSIFMPRWASRLTLRITDVRVERVRSISRADAIAEGIQNLGGDTERWGVPGEGCAQHPCRAYWLLWDSINGKKPGATWADNPWVWVVEFEREEALHA